MLKKRRRTKLTRDMLLQYLGIPLAAGIVTRAAVLTTLTPKARERFYEWFSPVALLGLLYTIIVLFANQVFMLRC
jgi:ACR3 family arsenite efflux pump ArsB